MTYKTIQPVSVPNLKLFGPMKTELLAKEVREVSIIWENVRGAFLPPPPGNLAATI